MSLKIEDIEPRFAQKLESGEPLKNILHEFGYQIPENYQARISLLDANGRKKRSSAAAENWSWESGRIELRFEIGAVNTKKSVQSAVGNSRSVPTLSYNQSSQVASNAVKPTSVHPTEADLVRVLTKTLDLAESRPGWNFVPLKKFRDEILPTENPSLTEVEWHNVLRSAIEKRLVLTGRVPNPKAPEFPVTTLRLNRLMPEVRALLGQTTNPDLDFHPVEIRGEPLSVTVLRERR
jgi:hypothetical protein